MKDKPKSKIETALDYIARHGTARTPAIAEALGVEERHIRPMLDPALRNGYLVSCQVEVRQPDGTMRKMMEYRVSEVVAESKANWREFTLGRTPARTRELKPPKALPPRVAAPAKPAAAPTPAAVPAVIAPAAAEAESPYTLPAPPAVQPVPESLFSIGSDRRLRIQAAGIELELSPDETKTLGYLLVGSMEIWRHREYAQFPA